MGASGRLLVLYGSQTFTAQEIAERLWRQTKALGFTGPVKAMDDYPISQLIHEEFVLFVCSTTGVGDEPDNMKKFWKFLLRRNLPSNSLVKLKFGVLGLGDSTYTKFNFTGKKLHKRLAQLGATPLLDIGLCDYQHDLGHDAVVIPWIKKFFAILKSYFPNLQTDIKPDFIPRWNVTLLKNEDNDIMKGLSEDIYFSRKKESNLEAFKVEIVNNDRVTDESHFQDVRLMTLKTIDNSKLDYKPGDIFNLRPRNSKEDVKDLFEIFEAHGIDIKPHYRLLVEELYEDMPVQDFLKEPLTLYKIAEQYWDLRAYPTQYFFSLLALVSEDNMEKDKCIEFSTPEGHEDWLNYCRRPKRTVLEVLSDFHKSASKLTMPVLFELFSSIKPRSFSIASSSLANENSLDLLVAVVEYKTRLKEPRLGLASNWLKSLCPGDQVYGWLTKGTMVFPKDESTPLILIGPGTGLAPFRSLLQQRKVEETASKNSLYLFFGCRYKEKDFYCKEELERMAGDGKLSLFCAFSRDQERKIYVQHRISENKELLWPLIEDQSAHIYVSGNAKNMPDNVRDAFIDDVLVATGKLSEEDARSLWRTMEAEGRVQVETW